MHMRLTDRWRRKSKIEADVDARIAEVETQSGEATSEKDCTIESVWPLMRQAFYKRKNEVEPLRKSMADFRGKKGYFLSGGKIIRQFNFTDKSISDDTQDIAEREIDDDVREPILQFPEALPRGLHSGKSENLWFSGTIPAWVL